MVIVGNGVCELTLPLRLMSLDVTRLTVRTPVDSQLPNREL